VLEDRTAPAAGLAASLNGGILRVTDWLPGDTVTLRQTAAGVALDAAGGHQAFAGVGQVFLDVQSATRVTNDTGGLGGGAARPVYVSRRDPTGRGFTQSGVLAPGATSGPAARDWFDAAFTDAGFRSLARARAADGRIDRADMFQLFAQVERDGTVSTAEYHDLGDLLHPERVTGAGAPGFSIPDAVRALAIKVVDGDPSNAHFQGAPLGDLHAGSSAAQLDELVGKWFRGADHPLVRPGETYRPVSGVLFAGGPSYWDVRQGDVGDCYFVAALAELAQESPQTIVNMFTDNGDGTFTVRFYRGGAPEYVTVDRDLPTDADGRAVYAGFGRSSGGAGRELWAALAEKAYAQLNESGWLGRDGTNSYAGLDGGYSDAVLQQVTGRAAGWTWMSAATAGQLAAAAATGRATVLGSLPAAPGNGVAAGHGYALVGYDPATGRFTLYNPWGSTLALTWDQVRASFLGYWQAQG
jgi:hypothetical protein